MNHTSHYTAMFYIMVLSGLLSTMNIWADKWDDLRFSVNDIYMILLMTGWMFLFMGIYEKNMRVFIFGLFLVVIMIWSIRTQFLVTTNQYITGMIPHHSMAVHMSKQLYKSKPSYLHEFVSNIIHTQEKEIEFMKKYIENQ